MDISVKSLLVSAIWFSFWLIVSLTFRNADPIRWNMTSYGNTPVMMTWIGCLAVFGTAVWAVAAA